MSSIKEPYDIENVNKNIDYFKNLIKKILKKRDKNKSKS